jgi:hypothetical protein
MYMLEIFLDENKQDPDQAFKILISRILIHFLFWCLPTYW